MAIVADEFPGFAIREAKVTPADRLSLTVFLAIVAHMVVVLGIVFVPHEPARDLLSTLDIVLVQHKTESTPEEADFLAQANQDGGGEGAVPERPATPLPAPIISEEAAVVAASPPAETVPPEPIVEPPVEPRIAAAEPPKTKPVLAMLNPDALNPLSNPVQPAPTPRQKPKDRPEPLGETEPQATPESLNAAALINRSLTMASLSAEIDQRLKAYAERPRRKWISARTREYKYASYMEAWRLKVERIGNLNYPDEARRKRLAGNLLLEVALNPDGTINDIMLRRSSGHRVLDDAAIRIVKLSAPFAPLPEAILEETDVLHIERTWRFLNTSRFSSG